MAHGFAAAVSTALLRDRLDSQDLLHDLTMYPTSIHRDDNREDGWEVGCREVEGFFHSHSVPK
jgi:hypothetical protein